MASATGNLEGQLERVEEQLRGVEEKVLGVEEQLRGVEEKVLGVEEQLRGVQEQLRGGEERILLLEEKVVLVEEQAKKSSDDEERKLLLGEKAQLREQIARIKGKEAQLRHEKAQLRHEKAQLRDQIARLESEKAQLREEKIQLLQRRDLGTEHEWLVQEVVVPDVPSRSRSTSHPSTSANGRRYKPVKVEHWDVKGDIEECFERADKRKRVFDLSVAFDTQRFSEGVKMEGFTVAIILSALQRFLEKKQPELKFGISAQIPLASMEKRRAETDDAESAVEVDERRLNEGAELSLDLIDFCILNPTADFIFTFDEKDAVIVEVKNGGLGPEQGDPWHLHKAWTECTCPTGEGDPKCRCEVLGITVAHGERLIGCISQLYDCMAAFEVGYGILTDCRDWYLFKRDNEGCLQISVGFKAMGGHPPFLAALLYVVDIAAKDNTKFGKGPMNGKIPKPLGAAAFEPSYESFDDDKSDLDFKGRGKRVNVLDRPRSTRNQRDDKELALKDVSVVDLNLKTAGGIISCEGWSGCVVVGRLYGQPVAVKFAHLNTERAKALVKEIVAYQRMEKLWGVFVPRLVGCGTTCSGRAIFVATELIDGVELGEEAVTEEVKNAALEALDAVHECGILHGDIEARNIMVVQGEQASVRILDFGFSCVTNKYRKELMERRRLEYLLAHM